MMYAGFEISANSQFSQFWLITVGKLSQEKDGALGWVIDEFVYSNHNDPHSIVIQTLVKS